MIARLLGSWSGRCWSIYLAAIPKWKSGLEFTLGWARKGSMSPCETLACAAPDLSIGGPDGMCSYPSSFHKGSWVFL